MLIRSHIFFTDEIGQPIVDDGTWAYYERAG